MFQLKLGAIGAVFFLTMSCGFEEPNTIDKSGDSVTCQTLRFVSTVTGPGTMKPEFVNLGETVTLEVDLQVDQADLMAEPAHGYDECFDMGGDFVLRDCFVREWSLPNATYTLTYSGGYSHSGIINRVRVVNGGETEFCFDEDFCDTSNEQDRIIFYDEGNKIWEAVNWELFGETWKEGELSDVLATELDGIGDGNIFDTTFYWGHWSESPGWGTYHYDYTYDRYTDVTYSPCSCCSNASPGLGDPVVLDDNSGIDGTLKPTTILDTPGARITGEEALSGTNGFLLIQLEHVEPEPTTGSVLRLIIETTEPIELLHPRSNDDDFYLAYWDGTDWIENTNYWSIPSTQPVGNGLHYYTLEYDTMTEWGSLDRIIFRSYGRAQFTARFLYEPNSSSGPDFSVIGVEELEKLMDAYGLQLPEDEQDAVLGILHSLDSDDLDPDQHSRHLSHHFWTHVAEAVAFVGCTAVAASALVDAGASIAPALACYGAVAAVVAADNFDESFDVIYSSDDDFIDTMIKDGNSGTTGIIAGLQSCPAAYFNNEVGGRAAQAFVDRFGCIPNGGVRATRSQMNLSQNDVLIIDAGGEGQKTGYGLETGNLYAMNLNWQRIVSPGNWELEREPGDVETVVADDHENKVPITNLISPAADWRTAPDYPLADDVADGIMFEGAEYSEKGLQEIARVVRSTGWIWITWPTNRVSELAELHNGDANGYTEVTPGDGWSRYIIPPSDKLCVDVSGVTSHTFYDFVRNHVDTDCHDEY